MKYKKKHIDTPELAYKRPGDAGLDLYLNADVTLFRGQVEFVSSEISVELPDNTVGLVAIRSSLGKRGVTIANGVGVIDAGYRGEIGLLLTNYSYEPVVMRARTAVAQLIVLPVVSVNPVLVDSLSSSVRGAGGFGSTG